LFSEEIYSSIHQSTVDKDKNNNTKNPTNSVKLREKSSKTIDDNVHKSIEKKSDLNATTSTLKRKRDPKSQTKIAPESQNLTDVGRKQASNTATILVSKTKTKSGLPLILRKE
jgi:hypothetical protein